MLGAAPQLRCLVRGSPISGRKGDAPKVRCRPLELDSNLCQTTKLLLDENYTTCLLFPTECVLQNEPLVGRYISCQADQCAMSTDGQGVCSFIKGRAFFWRPVSDNWNAEHKPLAAAFLRPRDWLTALLLKHRYFSIALALYPRKTEVDSRFPSGTSPSPVLLRLVRMEG